MGDGHINRSKKTPCLRAEMVTPEYLEYLDSVFPVIGSGVSKSRSAKEQATSHRKSGFNKSASEETYSDCYWWETLAHQGFENLSSWYDSGEKVFPQDLELSPTVLKNWYACDGGLCGRDYPVIRINLDNERERKDKIEGYFSNIVEDDIYWNEQDHYTSIRFSRDDSKRLIEYMGEPVPGFDYKWF